MNIEYNEYEYEIYVIYATALKWFSRLGDNPRKY